MGNPSPLVIDATGRDIHGEAARIRERGPLTRVVLPGDVEAWAVSSPELLKRLLTDPRPGVPVTRLQARRTGPGTTGRRRLGRPRSRRTGPRAPRPG
ncbi:hypothetical protein B1C81_03110 [Streptomyces sp. HG99]|nr:hypothetical protein B1C81_03110 [Streptomyces sp. HG99]